MKAYEYTFDTEHINMVINELQSIAEKISTQSLDEIFMPFNSIIEELLCLQNDMIKTLYEKHKLK